MEEYQMEFVKDNKQNLFSILDEIFEFRIFFKGDKQENSNKEDKQKSLKDYIGRYDDVKKSEKPKEKILQYFCDALNKIVPKNKSYKIKEMENIFFKIENLYNLNSFQQNKDLKFILAFPLFDSYISKIDNFPDKWEDIISPLDFELNFSSLKLNGSFESFYRNNKEKFDDIFLDNDPKTIKNWIKEKNVISIESLYDAKNNCEYLSQKEEEFFQILYLKTIIWKIYHNNKETVKEFIKFYFEIIYLASSNKISDEEKEKLFFKFLIDESQNIKEEEKESLLNYYINISKLIKNLEKNIENSKMDFEKIFINSIKRTKLNYEYNYYLYLSIDSYNLLNIEKEKYKKQELRDSTRFLEQLEESWKGKLNNKIIEEYKKIFKGEIRTIAEIFNIILEISPNPNLMIEIIFKRIFTNEKLVNKFLKYLEENFNINLIK